MHYDDLAAVGDEPTAPEGRPQPAVVREGVVFSPLPVNLTKTAIAAYYRQ